MAQPRIHLCPYCSRTRHDTPHEVCSRCFSDHRELVLLYNRIVRRFPALRRKTIVEVFSAMWEKVESGHRKGS